MAASVCAAGEVVRARCSLAYAPPDAALAALSGAQIVAPPAHDIWTIGVVASETIMQNHALTGLDAIADGRAPYLWELPAAEQLVRWRQSRLRPVLDERSARDAAQRPTAAASSLSTAKSEV
jgi:hypothetical protein